MLYLNFINFSDNIDFNFIRDKDAKKNYRKMKNDFLKINPTLWFPLTLDYP
jgi:hypothetical protein